jgi:hypothetical protein
MLPSSLVYSLAQKMAEICSFETSADFQRSTRCYTAGCRNEKLKEYRRFVVKNSTSQALFEKQQVIELLKNLCNPKVITVFTRALH